MDDEKLIALIEAKNKPYNKNSPYYKLQSRIDALWQEIGKKINASEEMCQRRWLALRDQYGRELTPPQAANWNLLSSGI
ncbi:transcription factor Adf-1-like [Bactrocera tryoni]|uniref:transcription factor Adf-1-like n=1 Tax=Bactrocera tryoni TaxID=59916 RepID=UPI001A96746A|nr:transcription factor Adf-1-like [Bactrocera tryoni]